MVAHAFRIAVGQNTAGAPLLLEHLCVFTLLAGDRHVFGDTGRPCGLLLQRQSHFEAGDGRVILLHLQMSAAQSEENLGIQHPVVVYARGHRAARRGFQIRRHGVEERELGV